MCWLSGFLDPGGWSKTAAVGLYFIFPEICTLSLALFTPNLHFSLANGLWFSLFVLLTAWEKQHKVHTINSEGRCWLHRVCTSLALVDVRKPHPEKEGKVEFEEKSQTAPHL
ncbi:hypothetical protein STEG23_011958 [Scotinomys teguina]